MRETEDSELIEILYDNLREDKPCLAPGQCNDGKYELLTLSFFCLIIIRVAERITLITPEKKRIPSKLWMNV